MKKNGRSHFECYPICRSLNTQPEVPDEAAVLGGREDVARGHRHKQRLDVNVFAVNRGACIKGTIRTTLESIFLFAII